MKEKRKEIVYKNYQLDDLEKIAKAILAEFSNDRFFCFYGSMGAGKTTLIQSMVEYLGSPDQASSPTFSIVHRYLGEETDIYHFDFYRIEDPHEVIQIGVEDYFNSGDYCFIEWPEKMDIFLPEEFIKIDLDIVDEDHRNIKVYKYKNQNLIK